MDQSEHVRGDVHRDATVLDHVRILGYFISGDYFRSRRYSVQPGRIPVLVATAPVREEPFQKV